MTTITVTPTGELPPGGTYAWHGLAEGAALAHTDPLIIVTAGSTYHVDGEIDLCLHGLHGSERAIDMLGYAPGPLVCRTYHFGTIKRERDKLCSSDRAVIWLADASHVYHRFAIWCAEQALLAERAAGREPHPASWAALEVKVRWLRGDATDAELDAARAAAWSAAWAAAWEAARAAARAAAWSAARAAARAAAWSAAAEAAWSAAWSAAWEAAGAAQNEKLTGMLLGLFDERVTP